MRLSYVSSMFCFSASFIRDNSLVQGDHHASSLGIVARCQSDGLQKVQRSICAQSSSRSHGTGDNDRLGRVDRHLQEESSLFQRVCSMRDHDAGDLLLRQLRGDAMGQAEQNGLVDRRTTDVRDLVAGNIGDVQDLGDSVDKCFHAEADTVTDGLSVA